MIHVVLVNFNGTDDTIACVQSLCQLVNNNIVVTIVDNRSTKTENQLLLLWGRGEGLVPAKLVANICENNDIITYLTGQIGGLVVNLIGLSRNCGFAGGNNVGMKLALTDPTCTHVWILNNDTEVDPGALSALIDRMAEDPQIGICGSTLVYYDDRATVQALGGRFNRRLARVEQLSPASHRDFLPHRDYIEREMDYVIGASMLVSRVYLETVGLMDERYFLYFEEIDWSIRSKGKFKLGWAPSSIVFHKEGGVIGTSSRARPSDLSLYYMSLSNLRFIYLHKPFLLPITFLRISGKALYYFIKSDRQAALVMMRAVFQFLKNCASASISSRD